MKSKSASRGKFNLDSTKNKFGIALLVIVVILMVVNLFTAATLMLKVQKDLSIRQYMYFKVALLVLFMIGNAWMGIRPKSNYGMILVIIGAFIYLFGLIVVNASPRRRRYDDSARKTMLSEFDDEMEKEDSSHQKLWKVVRMTDSILLSIVVIILIISLIVSIFNGSVSFIPVYYWW